MTNKWALCKEYSMDSLCIRIEDNQVTLANNNEELTLSQEDAVKLITKAAEVLGIVPEEPEELVKKDVWQWR